MQVKEQIPLWKQLLACADVVMAVRKGRSGNAAIEAVAPNLRAGVQALAFHVWRNLGRAQALREVLAPRTPPPAVDALLCVALALGWQQESAPYDVFTLVNQAAEAAKRSPAMRAQVSFVNGCLRRFERERDALVARTDANPVVYWNHPQWWITQLQADYPEHWQAILQANNAHPPMTLRVNTCKNSVAEYLQSLAAAGLAGHAVGDCGIQLEQAVAVPQLPGFQQGLVSVQDAAAQMAAPLLLADLDGPRGRSDIASVASVGSVASLRVLDACAAPGGKTAHLLEMGVQKQVALEVDAQRSARIGQTLERLGLAATLKVADASLPESWWDGEPFDRILLDAPCSASGIVRRHPDARWLRRQTDIAQLAGLQQRMLQALWPLLAPGGRLLYCTCSVFAAEGRNQVQTFLANNTDARQLPSAGHLMPGIIQINGSIRDNQPTDHDGFFYALLQKSET